MKRRALYDRRGPNAIDPQAYGGWFEIDVEPRADFEDCGGVAVVSIEGPLCQSEGHWFDDYGSIQRRVTAALASSCSSVVMRINSPGGEVFGCIETARALRAAASTAGKPLVSFIEGYGASGGYALACAGERIYALPSSLVGSVGVIVGLYDYAEANKRFGVNVVMVKSGARKADGHPDVALSEDALKAVQAQVDEMATHFVALVAEARGAQPEDVTGLEAGLFVATQATTTGIRLVDETTTLEQLLANLASGSTGARSRAPAQEEPMDKEKLLAALRKMAEGDDENADTAKAALAEIEGEKDEDPKAEDEGEDKKPEAEADEEPAEDDKKPAARAKGGKPKSALELRLEAVEQRAEKAERAQLLASRPDFSASTVTWLKSAPLATVRNAVKAIPKAEPAKVDPKAALTVQTTRGQTQASGGDRSSPEVIAELDRRMGFSAAPSPVRREGRNLILGVMTPEQARAHRAAKEGGK